VGSLVFFFFNLLFPQLKTPCCEREFCFSTNALHFSLKNLYIFANYFLNTLISWSLFPYFSLLSKKLLWFTEVLGNGQVLFTWLNPNFNILLQFDSKITKNLDLPICKIHQILKEEYRIPLNTVFRWDSLATHVLLIQFYSFSITLRPGRGGEWTQYSVGIQNNFSFISPLFNYLV
jgi:hypothetical protein